MYERPNTNWFCGETHNPVENTRCFDKKCKQFSPKNLAKTSKTLNRSTWSRNVPL